MGSLPKGALLPGRPVPKPTPMLPKWTATRRSSAGRRSPSSGPASPRAVQPREAQPSAPLDIQEGPPPLGPPASPLLDEFGRPLTRGEGPSLSERARQREFFKGRLEERPDLVGPGDTGRPFGEPEPWTPERPAPGQVRTRDVRLDVPKRPSGGSTAPLDIPGPLEGPPSSALLDAAGRPVAPVAPSVPTARGRRFITPQPAVVDPERAKLRELYKGRAEGRPDLTGAGPVGGPMQPFGRPAPWAPPEGIGEGPGRSPSGCSTLPSNRIEDTFGIELDQPQAPITPAAPDQAAGALDQAKAALDRRAAEIGETPGLTPSPGKLADPEWQRLRDQVQRGYRTADKADDVPAVTPQQQAEVAGGYKGKAREIGVDPATPQRRSDVDPRQSPPSDIPPVTRPLDKLRTPASVPEGFRMQLWDVPSGKDSRSGRMIVYQRGPDGWIEEGAGPVDPEAVITRHNLGGGSLPGPRGAEIRYKLRDPKLDPQVRAALEQELATLPPAKPTKPAPGGPGWVPPKVTPQVPGVRPGSELPPMQPPPRPVSDVPAPPARGAHEVIDLFWTDQDGVKIELGRGPQGYTVRVIDADSGEALPSTRIFSNEEAARKWANRVLEGKDPDVPVTLAKPGPAPALPPDVEAAFPKVRSLKDQPPAPDAPAPGTAEAEGFTIGGFINTKKPKPPEAPRFEKTAIGDQGVIGGTPDRAMPTGGLKPKGQGDIKDTPLFGQERAALEASQGTFDVDAGMRGTQQHAANEWLVDQLGSTFAFALKRAKSPTQIPPGVQVKLRTLGLDPTDAWQSMTMDRPPAGVVDRLVGKSLGQQALPAAPAPRPAPFQRKSIKGEVPDLTDIDDVRALVQGGGGIKVTDAVAGEMRDVPANLKNKNGITPDHLVERIREAYPGLMGGDDKAIWDQLVDTMRGGQKKPSGAIHAGMSDAELAQAEAAELKRAGIDPETVVTGRVSDQPPAPEDTALKKLVDFFSDIGQDEAGMLRPERFAVTWKRWRQKFPMESAARRRRPSSPVLSALEQYNAGTTDDVVNLVKQPWWNPRGRLGFSKGQGLRNLDPDAIKDAEEAAYREWWNTGTRTSADELASRHHFAPEMQEWMALRDQTVKADNAAFRFFDKDPVQYAPGPYVPRRLADESRQVAKLHREGGGGATVRAHLQGHEDLRTEGPTYRRAEAKTGREYEDPRNAILLREWDSIHLRRTHALFDYLLRRKGIFRTEQAAELVANQIPGAKPWRLEGPGIPGGTWWTATEEEAKLLAQNLSPHTPGSLAHYANALLRNPNLVNPAPHVTKNMLYKYTLANGPVKTARLGTDAAEYLSGRAATKNPALFRDFQETMAFSEQGQTAGEVLGRELHKPSMRVLGRTVPAPSTMAHEGLRVLGSVNKPSQKVIFQWADPAMRYGLYKSYRRQGMDKFEAANHAWEDLVRYGTRSDATDFWRKWPTNFFVPWRFGSAFSVGKQLTGAGRPTIAGKLHHAARAALVIAGAEYLREMRYRATGRWTHLPTDYVQKPVQEMLESGSPLEAGLVLGTMAVFGPGGEFSSRQIGDITKTMAAHGKNPEAERFKNAFWGVSQIFGEGGAWDEIQRGNVGNATMGLLFGEHGAHSYEPRRLMKYLPESFPGLQKSEAVQYSEADQARKQRLRERSEQRREQHPKRTPEQKLRGLGLIP